MRSSSCIPQGSTYILGTRTYIALHLLLAFIPLYVIQPSSKDQDTSSFRTFRHEPGLRPVEAWALRHDPSLRPVETWMLQALQSLLLQSSNQPRDDLWYVRHCHKSIHGLAAHLVTQAGTSGITHKGLKN